MAFHDRLRRLERELLSSAAGTYDDDAEPIFEERLAKHEIEHACGDLNHLQMLRGYGIYWQGSPESHQRFVQETKAKLLDAIETLSLVEVLRHCTDDELDRLEAGEPPSDVVEGFDQKKAREKERALSGGYSRLRDLFEDSL